MLGVLVIIKEGRRMNVACRRGFSLLECGIVLALLVLVLTLHVVQIPFLNRYIVRSEIEKMYAVCKYLQQYAMINRQQQELIFDITKNEYYFHEKKERLPKQVVFGFLSGAKGPPSSALSSIVKPITFDHQRIIFYPDGIVQAGTVYLVDCDKQFMYALSNGVAQISYLRKYKYDGTWLLL